MKFACDSRELQKSINIVEKAVSQKSTVPIMENIFFELIGQQLYLRGNDLEIGIENIIPIDTVESEGSVLIKAKTISSIVSKLNQQNLNIDVDTFNKILIKAANVDFEILGTSSEEYPKFPTIQNGVKITLPIEELKNLIKYTIFAVSFDETKQFLNGIMVKNEGQRLFFVSTDGYRLSVKNCDFTGTELSSDFSAIVPYKAMNELYKILSQVKSEEISINIAESQIAFEVDNLLLISRLIQGQFPDYRQVLPTSALNVFRINRLSLLNAAERASIIASASNNVVRLNFTDELLLLTANSPNMGEFKEDLNITRINGTEDIKIAFNVKLIIDAIKHLEIDDLQIEFNSEFSPCVIRPIVGDEYFYIIMPIHTAEMGQF